MGIFDFLKPKKKGIDNDTFYSKQYQAEITALAQVYYFDNNHDYSVVKNKLGYSGLTENQCNEVVDHLRKLNAEMVDDFQNELSSGRISEIKITPNPEHKKGKVDKEQVDKYIGYGAFQMERGDLNNALELFNKALELDDEATFAYANKGILYSKLGEDKKAIEFYDKAISLNNNFEAFYENKAISCRVLEKFHEEKKCYIEILRIDNNNIDALFALSQCNVRDGEFEAALSLINKVIKIVPNKEDLHGPLLSKIGILVELGKEKEANELYLQMAERFPEDNSIHDIIPNIYYFKEKRKEALDFFDNRYSITNNPSYLKYKADFLFHRDKAKALETYEEYLSIAPNDVSALECRLVLSSETNKEINGESEIEKILLIDPNNINALHSKLRLLFSENKFQDAIKIAEKIYALDKSNMDSIDLIIQISEKFKTETEIIEMFEELKHENNQEKYNIEFRKGLYYKSIGSFEKAISIFESQNQIHQFAWNYYQIAIIKNIQAKTDEALEYLKKTFELDPTLKQDAKQYHELENLWGNEYFLTLTK